MALAHAILVLLIDKPYSGYDLAKDFDNSLNFFWKATHQQIYRELARLGEQGWVNFEIIAQESRPDKKLYSITELGKKHLIEWLVQPSDLMLIKEELLIKLFAGNLIPISKLIEELERHRQIHKDKLSFYREMEQEYFCHPRDQLPIELKYKYLVLRRGIRYEADYHDWCDEAIELLKTVASN